MSTLIAITYDDLATGQQAFASLGEMQKMEILELEDAAFAAKDEESLKKVLAHPAVKEGAEDHVDLDGAGS